MPYSTLADVERDIGTRRLIQLTDDGGSRAVVPEHVEAAIAKASSLIDGYLSAAKYPLPMAPVPALVRDISISLAVYYLHARRVDNTMEPGIRARYSDAIALLDKIAAGTIRLEIELAPAVAQPVYAKLHAPIFGRDTLNKMP